MPESNKYTGLEIAIIGMAGRFPGVDTLDEFWEALAEGRELISRFTEEEMLAAGVSRKTLENNNYIKVHGKYAKAYDFDAELFGYSPSDAGTLDPQTRVFMETSFEALTDAGYASQGYTGKVGVFVGATPSVSWHATLLGQRERSGNEDFTYLYLADKDFMATQFSYKMNLKGISFVMNTACSSSLVAIDLACKNLLLGACDVAIAGGVSIMVPQTRGYLYEEGMIFSNDGHCRPFSRDAKGTVSGSGCGILVLKSLQQAMEDGDRIYAVIRSTSVNNDGNRKIGFTAPSVEGQSDVIRKALFLADVESESIGYVETHGTGTLLGDPIEIEALRNAFQTDRKQFCRIGSVKANIGHLDAAAGVASVIKTVMSLKKGKFVPSINFSEPNENIDFTNSPFMVNTELTDWPSSNFPRRAGVSSFGIGGTNAHAILEEAPIMESRNKASPRASLVCLSANSPKTLDRRITDLRSYVVANSDVASEDISFTLMKGHRGLKTRKAFIIEKNRSIVEKIAMIESPVSGTVCGSGLRDIVFVFPGQGSQYTDMGRDLYDQVPVFREELDSCFEIARQKHGMDLRSVYKDSVDNEKNDTKIIQPLLFSFEYALARTLIRMGIVPVAVMGHSLGEYVAACVAGVFTVETAMSIVVNRGSIMAELCEGRMVQVKLSERSVEVYLNEGLSIAAVNSPEATVLAGSVDAINNACDAMVRDGVDFSRLPNKVGFHSALVEPVIPDFLASLGSVEFKKPALILISNLTGKPLTELPDAKYWAQHLRNPVRFSAGSETVLGFGSSYILEVGPGKTLGSLLKQQVSFSAERHTVLNMTRHQNESVDDTAHLLRQIGVLWENGIEIDWSVWFRGANPQYLSLPPYPFDHRTYGIDAAPNMTNGSLAGKAEGSFRRMEKMDDWFYARSWNRITADAPEVPTAGAWLVLTDDNTFADTFMKIVKNSGGTASLAMQGPDVSIVDVENMSADFTDRDQVHAVVKAFSSTEHRIANIVMFMPGIINDLDESESLDMRKKIYYELPLEIAKALDAVHNQKEKNIFFIGNNSVAITGSECTNPINVMTLGVAKIIAVEYPHIRCRYIDIDKNELTKTNLASVWKNVFFELTRASRETVVALRNGQRWIPGITHVRISADYSSSLSKIVEKGTYVITGAFGGMGKTLARKLVEKYSANLLLIVREGFLPESEWDEILVKSGENKETIARIHFVRELRSTGAIVHLVSVDLSSFDLLTAALFSQGLTEYKIDGVFHTAGVIDSGGIISGRSPGSSDSVIKPKVDGTINIVKSFSVRGAPFFVFCSSVGNQLSILKYGQVAYNAVNEFLDAYAQYLRCCKAVDAVAIEWNDWMDVGMSVRAMENVSGHHEYLSHLIDLRKMAVTPEEGVEIFERLASSPYEQVIISPVDFYSVLHRHSEISRMSPDDILASLTVSHGSSQIRPDMSSEYVAPREGLELSIAGQFAEILGYDKIGVNDSFYEMGGDSIKAIQLVARLKGSGIDVTVPDILQNYTIASLSAFLEKNEGEQSVEGVVPIFSWQLSSIESEETITGAFHRIEIIRHDRLDPALTSKIFEKLCEHHDALRIRISKEDGKVRQYNHPYVLGEKTIGYFDLTESEDPDSERSYLIDSILGTCDFFGDDLVKCLHFTERSRDTVCLFVSNFIADVRSMEILEEDLIRLFNSNESQGIVSLGAKTKSYCSWVETVLTEAVTASVMDTHERVVVGYDSCGEYMDFSFKCIAETDSLERVCSNYGVDNFDLGVAAILATVIEMEVTASGTVLDVEMDRRPQKDYERTVGNFIVPVSIHGDIVQTGDSGELLKYVKERLRSEASTWESMQKDNKKRIYLIRDNSVLLGTGGTKFRMNNGFLTRYGMRYALGIRLGSSLSEFRFDCLCDVCEAESLMKLFPDECILKIVNIINECGLVTNKVVTPSDFKAKDLSVEDLDTIESLFD